MSVENDVITIKDLLLMVLPNGLDDFKCLAEEDRRYYFKGWEIRPVLDRCGISARKPADDFPPHFYHMVIEGPFAGVLESINYIEGKRYMIEKAERSKDMQTVTRLETELYRRFKDKSLFFWWDEASECYRKGESYER